MDEADNAGNRRRELNWVVRAGVATPGQLKAGVAEHKQVPGLIGFSVQFQPGKKIDELAKAGEFPNPQISVTTVEDLVEAARKAGYTITVVPSPGRGYHHTATSPMPMSDDLAQALSAVFWQLPNPYPVPKRG